MALVLHEDDAREVLTMADTIAVLEAAFRSQGNGDTQNQPRRRVILPEARGVLHVLSAYVPGLPGLPAAEANGAAGLVGLKAYTVIQGAARFVVLLYSGEDGRLLSIIEADWLGQMRTGAASGLATRYMARDDAQILGLIGTGGQARTQAMAVCIVRPIKRVLVYGRDTARREQFAAEMAQTLGIEVTPVASAEEAVRPADIVVTATTARDPVLSGSWFREGTHVNVMGSNWHNRREVDDLAVERSAIVAVDALDQAQLEAGDLLIPAHARRFDFARAVELGAIVAGKAVGRPEASSITMFKSLGIALEDVATAGLVYKLARERGLGDELAFLS